MSVNLVFTVEEAPQMCKIMYWLGVMCFVQGKFCQLVHALNVQYGKYRG